MSFLPASQPWPPLVSILGHSDSGKTLLVERLVPRLRARGLRVGVVKHCSHGIDVDHPGKDSDRIFKSGADVLAVGPHEALLRLHGDDTTLVPWLDRLSETCDVVLVEGFRETALPKIRLKGKDDAARGEESGDTLLVLADAEQGCDAAEQAVCDVIARVHAALPVYAAVLVGRDAPQAVAATTPFARRVVLVVPGTFPEGLPDVARLPAAPEVPGPMGCVLGAMRWQPRARWIVLGCEPAWMQPRAVRWLLEHTRPGADVVLPALPGALSGDPLFAAFEPTARPLLEQAAGQGQWSLGEALKALRVLSPELPDALTRPAGGGDAGRED